MRRAFFLLGLALLAGQAAATEMLYGGVGRGSGVNPGALLSVDQSNGSGVLIGDPITPGGLTGIDFSSNGTLFGTSIADQPAGRVSDLVTIDPMTGMLLTSVPILDSNYNPFSIGDLAIQPGTNALFGIRSNADGNGLGGRLYTIDATTGHTSLVGDTGEGRGGGIAFAPDGTLYFLEFNELHTVDSLTGDILVTFILDDPGLGDGLAVRPSDGLLFATGAGVSDGDGVFTIDADTGKIIRLGSTGAGALSDLAFRPASVPEPASLTLLGLGLAGLGFAGRRLR